MAKRQSGQRKKQDRALKKRSQRKRKLAQQKVQSLSPVGGLRQARNDPIEGCWAQRTWRVDGLAMIVLARRQRAGTVAFGMFLVDYYCLGLKDTQSRTNVPTTDFHSEFLGRLYSAEPPIEMAPALAHEIIYGAIEYAEQFGFKPHRDFKSSRYILDPPDAHPRTGEFEFGKDGKPLYISGPRDNPEQIIRQLERTAGKGNFHFVTPLGEPDDGPWDDEDEADEGHSSSGLWVPGDKNKEDEGDSSSGLWVPGR